MHLSELNSAQIAAVTAPLGAVLVLAGAGSGKTRVLTYRLAYIIEQGWFESDTLLALTFTNKAAKEMRHRIDRLLVNKLPGKFPILGTFHAVGAKILRKEISRLGMSSSFAIIDADDQLKILKVILKNKGITEKFTPNFFRLSISRAKNLLQTPAEYRSAEEPELTELVTLVYTDYNNELQKQNLVDLDDLLFLPVRIFQAWPEILKKYQNIFRYLLVDEYQDTNHAQYVLLKMLVTQDNLFVVGDDAQSIYGFRGSNIENILNFEKDFPNARVFKLEQNYRSTKNILAVAQGVIEINTDQKPKTLWTQNEAGEKVRIEEVENEYAEAKFVAESITALASGQKLPEPQVESLVSAGGFSILDHYLRNSGSSGVRRYSKIDFPHLPEKHTRLSEFCVLFRTHAQSRVLEEVFIQAGIPYKIVGGVRFYERKEIKDVLAYLRFLRNPKELLSFQRVVNLPARGLGEKSAEVIGRLLVSFEDPDGVWEQILVGVKGLPLASRQQTQAQLFFSEMKFLNDTDVKTTLSGLIRLLVKRIGLDKLYKDKTHAGEERYDNVLELISVAKRFDSLPWRLALDEFLDEAALMTDTDTMEEEVDVVTLMTLHSVKGLEFDTVFFVGLEEGLLPHARSLLDEKELSEEVRLAYVGLTRARRRLVLVYARSRTVYGESRACMPSRILHVLPPANILSNGTVWQNETNELIYENIDF